jgi:hypothetical protein
MARPLLARISLSATTVALVAVACWEGCGGETWHPAATLDCSGEGSYFVAEKYMSLTQAASWFSYHDSTPTGVIGGTDGGVPLVTPIEGDGGRCGSSYALTLVSSGFQDYGSAFGDYGFNQGHMCPTPDGGMGACGTDASGYEGIAFWARSPGVHSKSVTLEITDTHSDNGSVTQCLDVITPDGGGAQNSGGATNTTMPSGSTGIPSPSGTCGNYFSYVLRTTDDWQLYKIPFSSFYQAPQPNRSPGGFDPSNLALLLVVVPKEANLQLWIDEIGFYPNKDGG